tara:strand:- start:90184 stop:91539 length:1356 start_codon:yes stop_codon:yes gene_type:complete
VNDATILIVDDDRAMCEMLDTALQMRGYRTTWCLSADAALQHIKNEPFDVVLTDVRMPGTTGLQLCQQIHELRPDIPVIVITAFGTMETAVAAMRSGAYDFIDKPVELEMLALTVARAVERRALTQQIRLLEQRTASNLQCGDLLGESEAMQRLCDQVNRVATSDASILITGESGTGKELAARSIHKRSERCDQPFVAVNCAALSETLLESELFGHVKGAFTDARSERKGLFLDAEGGTLLLDEIGDMPSSMQVKLLRALEEKRLRPVGADHELPFDVRVLAATHRDLETAVEEGHFREDLFYRINVIQLHMPPLRSRGTDILLLAQHFLRRFSQSAKKEVTAIAEPAARKLLSYAWPGNVRELRNVIERAVALTRHDAITIDDLPQKILDYRGAHVVLAGDDPTEMVTLEQIERRYIDHVMTAVDGNQTQAAKILGIDRKTLYRKLKSDA